MIRLPLIALPLLLAACWGKGIPHAEDWGDVPDDRALAVFKVRLTPPLTRDEQVLNPYVGRFRNAAQIYFDDEHASRVPMVDAKRSKQMSLVRLGELVFVPLPRRPTHLAMGVIYTSLGYGPADTYGLPGGLRLELAPDDRAVYLGTVEYQRDEFNVVTKGRVLDESAEAEAAYRALFGDAVPLRKALARPVPAPPGPP